MTARSPGGGFAVEYQGDWSAADHRGFVRSATVVTADGPVTAGTTWTFHDWTESPIPGVWVAARVTRADRSASRPTAEWKFEGWVLPSAAQIESALMIPRVDRADDFRGLPQFTRVYDARANQDLPTTALVGAIPNLPTTESVARQRALIRVIGWCVAAVLILGLLALRIADLRRRRAASTDQSS